MRKTWSSWSVVPFGKETHEWNCGLAQLGFTKGQPEVTAERLGRILARLVAAGASPSLPGPLCEVAAEIIGITGAGVMVLADGVPQASLCTTGRVSALIEELQYTLGEGPCIDAYRTGAAVAEPDLAAPSVHRWPAFAPKWSTRGPEPSLAFRSVSAQPGSAPSTSTGIGRVR